MPIVDLSQNTIGALRCPDGKSRIEYCDRSLPGLFIEVRASGNASWWLRYKNSHGATSYQRIGNAADLNLADARKRAKQLKAEIALGADPRGAAKAQKEITTLDAFFTDHYLPYVKPRKRSWKRDAELYTLRISAAFGKQRLDQLTRQQIQGFHTKLQGTGLAPATCDHHVKLIKHALNLAVDWGMLEKNPAYRIPLFNADNKREHYLDGEELQRLMSVLRTDENRAVCRIAMFLLSTGARLNEALSATWDRIDQANRVWRISAINSKSKRMRSVPLNDSALEVLAEVGTEGKYAHVFVNAETGRPYVTIAKVWNRLRTAAGLPHLRLHDLRHSFASFLVNSGRTLYEVQKVLGHSDAIVTARYAHLSSKILQDAANSASLAIKGATQVPG